MIIWIDSVKVFDKIQHYDKIILNKLDRDENFVISMKVIYKNLWLI